MPNRRIVGNLDAESQMASASARPPALPARVRRLAAGFSTLLRAFARDGDELWTLAEVDPARLAEVPGLPRPRLLDGRLSALTGTTEVLAWAETPAVAAVRAPSELRYSCELAWGTPLHELVWQLPPPDPAVVAAVHHRGFGLEVARRLGRALPGARLVESIAECESAEGAWVVKAPLSAAGRDRVIHRGGPIEPAVRRALDGLFKRHGTLLYEPWMDRVEDFGCAAVVTPRETRLVGFHRLLVDRRGQFTGLELDARFDGAIDLPPGEETVVHETLDAVGRALREAGYVGTFGIDLWRYRTPDGRVALHPLGEINARMTFGLVARALVDRVAPALGWAADRRLRLVFGRCGDEPPGKALLQPDGDGSAVWLE